MLRRYADKLRLSEVVLDEAAAHLGLGDYAKALALAEEAIAICRRLDTRLPEISTLLTRIRALRETLGVQATSKIEATLAEAEACS